MTEILSAARLPEILEDFAIQQGGEPWRNRMVGGLALSKTTLGIDKNASNSTSFFARLYRESPEGPMVVSYDLTDAATDVLDELPEEVQGVCDEVGIRLSFGGDDNLYVTDKTTLSLRLSPAEQDGRRGMIHEIRTVEYGLNHTTFLAGQVYGEALVINQPNDGDVKVKVQESPDLSLALVRYYLVGEAEPVDTTDELMALFSENGVVDPVEQAANTMLQGLMTFQPQH